MKSLGEPLTQQAWHPSKTTDTRGAHTDEALEATGRQCPSASGRNQTCRHPMSDLPPPER